MLNFKRRHTIEFSIIAHLDSVGTKDVQQIRSMLPASPYRDDAPHVTLLQGILTPGPMSDKRLLKELNPVLDAVLSREPQVRVIGLSNLGGGPYGATSAILLAGSEKLQAEHQKLLQELSQRKFKSTSTIYLFMPHISIRLGVPLSAGPKAEAERLFPKGRELSLSSWAILRLVADKPSRPMYELDP